MRVVYFVCVYVAEFLDYINLIYILQNVFY